jgi:hypothetical protein
MKKLLFSCLLLTGLTWQVKAATNAELSFYFGPSLSQNGAIEDLGTPTFSTAFEFNYFFKPSHGIGIAWGNEFDFEGTSKFPSISDASMHTWDLHYSFRHRFEGSKFDFLFEPGFGIQTLYDEYRDYYWGYFYYDDLSTAWIWNYKLMLRYMVSEWDSGGNERNFFVGAGITQIFSSNDELNGRDISGNRLSALLQLGVGF